jgi:hypothetical protein
MKNNIRQSVIDWNNRFPLDRWWRSKYNVPFLSSTHRESTFYSQYFDFYEQIILKELQDEKEKRKEEKGIAPEPYRPLSGNWYKGKVISEKDIDDWFNSPI